MDSPSTIQPVVALGDYIKVYWSKVDETLLDTVCEVVKIKRSSKEKHGSWFNYTLKNIDDDEDVKKTRLLHVKYKVKPSKKRKLGHLESPNTARSSLPNYSRILAPMVGGSELAFRLLCRKYGATLAYTPMMNSERFASDEVYRSEIFQTTEQDRPLVAHFSANDPNLFLKAAKLVEPFCDAVDLNLGCPQRIAYAGHFGSYLLDEVDRDLVLSMVKNVSSNISVPLFVKIRLLDTVPDTIRLCDQLIRAGASLIAIHGRYRVNLVGRTGPGARDGPAHLDQIRDIKRAVAHLGVPIISNGNIITWDDCIENLRFTEADGVMSAEGILDDPALYYQAIVEDLPQEQRRVGKPHPITLANEYLDFAVSYPVPVKSVIFHVRRMLKHYLDRFQIMDECLSADSIGAIREIVAKVSEFNNAGNFVESAEKARRVKEMLERKKREESKRKEYEQRMIRKAKREGKPLDFYLRIGLDIPTAEEFRTLNGLAQEERFALWKQNFGQHCFAYHFSGGCPRERSCAFLHVDIAYSDEPVYG